MGLWPAGVPSRPHRLLRPPAPRTARLPPARGPRRPAASDRTRSCPGPPTCWWGLASGEPPQVSGGKGEGQGSASPPPPFPFPVGAALGWRGPSPPSPGSWGGCSRSAPIRAAAPPRARPPPRRPPRRAPVRINPADGGRVRACVRASPPGADAPSVPHPTPTPDPSRSVPRPAWTDGGGRAADGSGARRACPWAAVPPAGTWPTDSEAGTPGVAVAAAVAAPTQPPGARSGRLGPGPPPQDAGAGRAVLQAGLHARVLSGLGSPLWPALA